MIRYATTALSKARLILLLPLVASGCMHLYSASDHQLATSAQAAFADAKLSESLKGEHAVLDSVLAREIAAVRRQSAAQRDTRLRQIVGASTSNSWKQFDDLLSREIEQDVGQVTKDATKPEPQATADSASRVVLLIQASSDMKDLQRSLESDIDIYRLSKGEKDPELACPLGNIKAPAGGYAAQILTKYQGDCVKYLAAQQTIATTNGGELGAENKLIADIENAERAQKDAIKALDADYAKAKKDYSDAVARRDGSELAAIKALHQQLAKLDDAQSKASALDKEFGELKLSGPISALEKEKESIDKVLGALLSDSANVGKPPADSTKGELAVLEWIAALHRDNFAASYPNVGALLLGRESLRLRLDAAKRSQANAVARLALLRQKRDLLLTEVTSLNQARNTLRAITHPKDAVICTTTRSVSDAFELGSGPCRERIATALLSYANAWTLGHMPRNEIDYRVIATRHGAVLDASENALAQWESLIKIPIDNLLAYHASGTKPQDLAALLNALGLGALAATR